MTEGNGDTTMKYTMSDVAEGAQMNTREGKAFAAAMTRLLEKMEVGDSLAIPNVGVFEKRVTKERKARNPKTGDAVMVPPKTRVKFRVSNNLRDL